MLKSVLLTHVTIKYVRYFALPPPGCPSRRPKQLKHECPSCGPVGRRRVEAPACRPANIPPNPCMPRYYHGKDKIWKRYKYIVLFVCLPIILVKSLACLNECPPSKPEPCIDYEYLRRRTKRFPWGDGVKTFFHNDHANILPGECEELELEECEDE